MDIARDDRNLSGLDDLSFNMDFEARDSNHDDGPINLFGDGSGGGGGGGGEEEGYGVETGGNFSFDF